MCIIDGAVHLAFTDSAAEIYCCVLMDKMYVYVYAVYVFDQCTVIICCCIIHIMSYSYVSFVDSI